MGRSKVVIELAGNAALARDLAAGGVFVPGCTLAMAEECELVVCGAHDRLSLPARVVYLDAPRGAGLELIGFSTAMREQLAELAELAHEPAGDDLALPTSCHVELSGGEDPEVAAAGDAVPVAQRDDDEDRTLPVPAGSLAAAPDAAEPAAPDDDLAVPIAHDDDDDQRTVPVWTRSLARLPVEADRPPAGPPPPGAARRPPTSDLGHSDPGFSIAGAEADAAFFDAAEAAAEAVPEAVPEAGDADSEATGAEAGAPGDAADPAAAHAPRNVHERLRGLTLAAQIKLATSGEQHERIALERLYGKNVWEPLLRNPRLTPPEVARIARYGSLPRVLLEIVLGSATWLQIPEVRRALLSNPRLGTDQVLKVLRLTPRHELRLAAVQTAYPHTVRQAARMLLRSE